MRSYFVEKEIGDFLHFWKRSTKILTFLIFRLKLQKFRGIIETQRRYLEWLQKAFSNSLGLLIGRNKPDTLFPPTVSFLRPEFPLVCGPSALSEFRVWREHGDSSSLSTLNYSQQSRGFSYNDLTDKLSHSPWLVFHLSLSRPVAGYRVSRGPEWTGTAENDGKRIMQREEQSVIWALWAGGCIIQGSQVVRVLQFQEDLLQFIHSASIYSVPAVC